MIIGHPILGGSFLALFQFWKYHDFFVFERILSLYEYPNFVISSYLVFWTIPFPSGRTMCLGIFNFEILTFLPFYPLFDFEVSLICSILRWSLFAGDDHGCLSCIFKFQIQATGASTTGGLCFFRYTEYNTQGIHENSQFLFFSFARQKSWKTHCGTNGRTHARCLWNRWFYETVFPGVWRLVDPQCPLFHQIHVIYEVDCDM